MESIPSWLVSCAQPSGVWAGILPCGWQGPVDHRRVGSQEPAGCRHSPHVVRMDQGPAATAGSRLSARRDQPAASTHVMQGVRQKAYRGTVAP